jgi:hypothetical protein
VSAAEAAAGLRDLADWIEAHPELAVDLRPIQIKAFPPDEPESVRTWAVAMGKAEKEYVDTLFSLNAFFGPVKLSAIYWRDRVCQRVVTGTRHVVETVRDPEALEAVPLVEVEREEEIVEWICEPILAEAAT